MRKDVETIYVIVEKEGDNIKRLINAGYDEKKSRLAAIGYGVSEGIETESIEIQLFDDSL